MLLNTIGGFIIPWIIAIYIIKKDSRIIVLIAPIGSVLAFVADVLGFHFGYWQITPFHDVELFAALPMHLGIYPVLATFMIYFYHHRYINKYVALFGFTLLITLVELAGVFIEKVHYYNGWTIYHTFFSYLIPLALVFVYYTLLTRIHVLTRKENKI